MNSRLMSAFLLMGAGTLLLLISDWKVVLGILLFIWGNNLERMEVKRGKKKRK